MLKLGVYALVVRGQGQDLLMGKNIHDFVKVPGLESLLHDFIADLDTYFSAIYRKDTAGFLKKVEAKTKIKLMDLEENLHHNLDEMQDSDFSDDIMVFYLVITKTLETLRQKIFDQQMWEWIQEVFITKTGKKMAEKMMKKLKEQGESSDADFSLLYSLVFIHYLAQIYNNTGVIKQSKKISDEIIDHILSSS